MAGSLIALDVMGGDDAPRATLEGALLALKQGIVAQERLLLVGDEPRMRAELAELGGDPGFRSLHASQVIEMGESPAQALRAKPDNSIMKCVGAVKLGHAGAVV
ncbi:MAG: phosphate--acyl-ACP acyltransferase, partial [Planctomycetota bacterium]